MNKLRSIILPVENKELIKFFPMAFMMFFIIFVYFILRNTKDTLIINAMGGSGLIPYLKGFLTLPIAILFVVLYTKLINTFKARNVFYMMVCFFIFFYAVYGYILSPNLSFFHPSNQTINSALSSVTDLTFLGFPIGNIIAPFIEMWGIWCNSLFYVFSELWGSVMISLLFWQFANQVTKTNEAKRFYPLFSLIANLSPIAAGFAMKYFADMCITNVTGISPWDYTMRWLTTLVIISCLLIIFLYWLLSHYILHNTKLNPAYKDDEALPKKEKVKLSVRDSLTLILRSKYLGLIAILVIAYGISINLIELVWKNQLNYLFTTKNDLQSFMGTFSIIIGCSTILIILFFKSVINRFGWFVGAIITPAVTLVSGTIFFVMVIWNDYLDPLAAYTGLTALYISVCIGTMQNVLTKGFKYALFDPTKEMAYIPLDKNSKRVGKAAVDVIGGRLGKAGGGYIAGIFILPFFDRDVMKAAPILFGIVIVILVFWLFSVFLLGNKYKKLLKENNLKN